MVWNPTLVMTGIDLAIIAAVICAWLLLTRRRDDVRRLALQRGLNVALTGLAVIASFAFADLFLLHVQPLLTTAERAAAQWMALHVAWSRFVKLCAVIAIVVGLAYLVKRAVAAAVQAATALEDAQARLVSASSARERAEAALRDADRELEARVAQRTMELHDSEARFRALYHESPTLNFTVDHAGRLLSVNRFGAGALGYTVEELAGVNMSEFLRREDRDAFHACVANCFAQPGAVHEVELAAVDRRKHSLWLKMTGRVIDDPRGQPVALIVCDDVTDLHRLSQRLSHQASHDVLTGLVNRREFERRLGRVLATLRDNTVEYALCYLDLDKFKLVNDSCGHEAGDELLRQLGNVLRKRIRKRDTLARLGGDEFAVLLEHCTTAQARRFADELCSAIGAFRFVWEGKPFDLGVSIGLIPLHDGGRTIEQVMSEADEACYAAKKLGRNRVYTVEKSAARLELAHGADRWYQRLQHALRHDGFRLYQQPIFPMRVHHHARRHYEVLLRMVDDAGNVLPPGTFIRSVERLGLAPEVDRWVVAHVIDGIARDQAHIDTLYLASVNLSGMSLSDDGFIEFLRRQLAGNEQVADKLCFEVTETAAISTPDQTARHMHVLRDMGCHFALDDFGSGASSFEYLKRLPVDFVKIDGLFVRNVARDPVDYLMVSSFHEIAETMGKQTIAECVENQGVYEKLFEIGVTYVQGFGLAEPRPLFGDVYEEPMALSVPG